MIDILCSFEEPCAWISQWPPVNGSWAVGVAGNNTEGPSYDHTMADDAGHYAYLHLTDHSIGAKTGLYMSPFASSDDICVDFWYHMDGANSKTLTLQADVGSQPIGNLLHILL